jgi:hypothetical protein
MKNKALLLLISLALVFAFATPAALADVLTPAEEAYLSLIDYDNYDRMLKYTSFEIGSHVAASHHSDLTAQFLANEFRNAGYTPVFQEFPMRSPTGSGTGTNYNNGYISIGGKDYNYFGHSYAASTVFEFNGGKSKAVFGIAIVNWNTPSSNLVVPPDANYQNRAVVVLNNGTAAPSAAAYYAAARDLQARGAGAVIFELFRPNADDTTSYGRIANTTPSASNTAITIPVGLTLYKETHDLFTGMSQAQLDAAVMQVTMQTRNTGRNVYAEKKAKVPTEKTVYITSHYDTVMSGPGVNDNMSGTIMVVELARAFKDVDFEYNIVFMCCDAEEMGLWGSGYFAYNMTASQKANFVSNYNMDMIGTSYEGAPYLFMKINDSRLNTIQSRLTAGQRSLDLPEGVRLAKEYPIFSEVMMAVDKIGLTKANFGGICYASGTDNWSFTNHAGTYTNMLNNTQFDWRRNLNGGSSFEPHYHRTGDTYERMSRERYTIVGNIVALGVAYSAKAPGIEGPDSPANWYTLGSLTAPAEIFADTSEKAINYTVSLARAYEIKTFEISAQFDPRLEYKGFKIDLPANLPVEYLSDPAKAYNPVTGEFKVAFFIGGAGGSNARFITQYYSKIATITFEAGKDLLVQNEEVRVEGLVKDFKITTLSVGGASKDIPVKDDGFSVKTLLSDSRLKYDINGDGVFDMLDISTIIDRYYLWGVGHARWDEAKLYDVVADGIIDIHDIVYLYSLL